MKTVRSLRVELGTKFDTFFMCVLVGWFYFPFLHAPILTCVFRLGPDSRASGSLHWTNGWLECRDQFRVYMSPLKIYANILYMYVYEMCMYPLYAFIYVPFLSPLERFITFFLFSKGHMNLKTHGPTALQILYLSEH